MNTLAKHMGEGRKLHYIIGKVDQIFLAMAYYRRKYQQIQSFPAYFGSPTGSVGAQATSCGRFRNEFH